MTANKDRDVFEFDEDFLMRLEKIQGIEARDDLDEEERYQWQRSILAGAPLD